MKLMELSDTKYLKDVDEFYRVFLSEIVFDEFSDEVIGCDYSLEQTKDMFNRTIGECVVNKHKAKKEIDNRHTQYGDTQYNSFYELEQGKKYFDSQRNIERLLGYRLILDELSDEAFEEAKELYVYQYPPYGARA